MYRKTGNLLAADPVSAECQLAGIDHLAGGQEGAELPKCLRAGAADEQRAGSIKNIDPGYKNIFIFERGFSKNNLIYNQRVI